jgi:hypothetical protein
VEFSLVPAATHLSFDASPKRLPPKTLPQLPQLRGGPSIHARTGFSTGKGTSDPTRRRWDLTRGGHEQHIGPRKGDREGPDRKSASVQAERDCSHPLWRPSASCGSLPGPGAHTVGRLFADPQPADHLEIALPVVESQVFQQARTLRDHLQQPTAAGMVLRVRLEMLGQIVDPCRQ